MMLVIKMSVTLTTFRLLYEFQVQVVSAAVNNILLKFLTKHQKLQRNATTRQLCNVLYYVKTIVHKLFFDCVSF